MIQYGSGNQILPECFWSTFLFFAMHLWWLDIGWDGQILSRKFGFDFFFLLFLLLHVFRLKSCIESSIQVLHESNPGLFSSNLITWLTADFNINWKNSWFNNNELDLNKIYSFNPMQTITNAIFFYRKGLKQHIYCLLTMYIEQNKSGSENSL